jgi:hypothetical protein
LEGRCERHLFDRAIDLCGRCGGEYCTDCLVYSFGPSKPPYCLPCAVARAGVRSNAPTYRALSGRQQRQLRKRRKEALGTAPAANAPVEEPEEALTPEPVAFTAEPANQPYEWFATPEVA